MENQTFSLVHYAPPPARHIFWTAPNNVLYSKLLCRNDHKIYLRITMPLTVYHSRLRSTVGVEWNRITASGPRRNRCGSGRLVPGRSGSRQLLTARAHQTAAPTVLHHSRQTQLVAVHAGKAARIDVGRVERHNVGHRLAIAVQVDPHERRDDFDNRSAAQLVGRLRIDRLEFKAGAKAWIRQCTEVFEVLRGRQDALEAIDHLHPAKVTIDVLAPACVNRNRPMVNFH